jgi:hypothetical protein
MEKTMKLLSTEIDAGSIQITYTDGSPVTDAKQVLIYRQPFDGDLYKTVAWNQLRVVSALADWANDERRRLRDEIEKNI